MVQHQSFQVNAENFHFGKGFFLLQKGKRNVKANMVYKGLFLLKGFLVQISKMLTSKNPNTEASHYGLGETCQCVRASETFYVVKDLKSCHIVKTLKTCHVVKALDVACKEKVVQRNAGTLNQ